MHSDIVVEKRSIDTLPLSLKIYSLKLEECKISVHVRVHAHTCLKD